MNVLRGQGEIFQVVVSRCVSVGVEAGGEVTAGHGDAHDRIADAYDKGKLYASIINRRKDVRKVTANHTFKDPLQ